LSGEKGKEGDSKIVALPQQGEESLDDLERAFRE